MTAPVVDVPMQRCLDAMAWLEHHGVPGPWVRGQIAPLARPAGGGKGYHPFGIEFYDALVRLRMASMVTYPTPDTIDMTVAGCRAGRLSVERPAGQSATEELHGAIRAVISGPMNRCLDALIERYPKAMTKAMTRKLVEHRGDIDWGSPILYLENCDLVEFQTSRSVRARSWLFLDGDSR